jgi:hypothetical protein
MFNVQFAGQGETILVTVQCTGTELQPGQSTKMDCGGLDSFPIVYQEICVGDLF